MYEAHHRLQLAGIQRSNAGILLADTETSEGRKIAEIQDSLANPDKPYAEALEALLARARALHLQVCEHRVHTSHVFHTQLQGLQAHVCKYVCMHVYAYAPYRLRGAARARRAACHT